MRQQTGALHISYKFARVLLQRLRVVHAYEQLGFGLGNALIERVLRLKGKGNKDSIHDNALHLLLIANGIVVSNDATHHYPISQGLLNLALLHLWVCEQGQVIHQEEDVLPLFRSLSHIQHRHTTERGHRDQNQENPVNRQQHQTLTQTQIGDVRNHPARDVLGITREERTHHLESELRVLLEEEEAAVDENGQVVSDGGGRDDVEHRQQPAKEGGNAWGEGDKKRRDFGYSSGERSGRERRRRRGRGDGGRRDR